MLYAKVAEAYELMERTTKRLELTEILSTLFRETPKELIQKVVYLTQGKLYPDFLSIEIGVADKLAIRAIGSSSLLTHEEIVKEYQSSGDLGEASRVALMRRGQSVLFSEPLTVDRVYSTFEEIARVVGAGSVEFKLARISSLLSDASPIEAKYIIRTITGKLRLGIADYTVLDALAVAFTGEKENRGRLERAYNISSDLGLVARSVAYEGINGAKRFRVRVGNPIRPMLAERLRSAGEIVEKLGGRVAAEYKLDGERLQVHMNGKEVKIFSRRLENITSHYPDVEKTCRECIEARKAIVEGEAVAVDVATGEYLPFQELMHRRRKYGIEEAVEQYPVSLSLFDILFLERRDLTTSTYELRRTLLDRVVRKRADVKLVERIVTNDPDEIENFMEKGISEGAEGLMIKALDGVYRAGAREFLWIKLKREYRSELSDTLDLVVIGGLHGKGRRVGRYGALLLGAYENETDTFRSFCKVGTGFTDDHLKMLYESLEGLRLRRRDPRVDSRMEMDIWFEPRLVLEIMGSEITLSPIHTTKLDAIRSGFGLALRFPKFTGRVREDKRPEDATTTDELLQIYSSQRKRMGS